MHKLLMVALAAGTAAVSVAPAHAAQGCGPGGHRGYYGHCRPNYGPRDALVVHRFYAGRGYWDGNRYWWHRRAWHGGWRYY